MDLKFNVVYETCQVFLKIDIIEVELFYDMCMWRCKHFFDLVNFLVRATGTDGIESLNLIQIDQNLNIHKCITYIYKMSHITTY